MGRITTGNTMRSRLKENKYVVEPFVKRPSPELIEIMGRVRFDYVIIDCEHGP